MKKVLLTVLMLCVATQAYALLDDNSTTNNTTVNITKVKKVTKVKNVTKVTNVTKVNELDLEYGVGADLKLLDLTKVVDYKGILDSVNAEYKYDMNNQAHSIYGVVKLDLTFWQK